MVVIEKRKYKRYTLNVMEVHGSMTLATDVSILDISIGGIALQANRRLDIDREYILSLRDRNKEVHLRGTVVWSMISQTQKGLRGEVVPLYTAGIKFAGMPDDKIRELQEFIDTHKMEELTILRDRKNVRFRIHSPEKTLLHFPDHYRVKKIGLGGMLIECEHDFAVESVIPMEIAFPDLGSMNFQGRIASKEVLAGSSGFALGIEFINVQGRNKELLRKFIEICEAQLPMP